MGEPPARAGKATESQRPPKVVEPPAPEFRRLWLGAALGALWLLGGCGGGVSGEIGQACMAGGRSAANPRLCACIQGVANQTLTSADQRRAARFFTDPDEAEQMRASGDAYADAFWDRYRAFASHAEAICRG